MNIRDLSEAINNAMIANHTLLVKLRVSLISVLK